MGHPCTRVCSDVSWANCCFVYSGTKSTLLFSCFPPTGTSPAKSSHRNATKKYRRRRGHPSPNPSKTENQLAPHNFFGISPARNFVDIVVLRLFPLFNPAAESLQVFCETLLAESRLTNTIAWYHFHEKGQG